MAIQNNSHSGGPRIETTDAPSTEAVSTIDGVSPDAASATINLKKPSKRSAKFDRTKAEVKTVKNEAKPKPAARPAEAKANKTEMVLKRLRLAKGTNIAMLMEATGWQAHSVRGFLSAVVKKKLGLNLVSEVGKDGVRRYRINDGAKDA